MTTETREKTEAEMEEMRGDLRLIRALMEDPLAVAKHLYELLLKDAARNT